MIIITVMTKENASLFIMHDQNLPFSELMGIIGALGF